MFLLYFVFIKNASIIFTVLKILIVTKKQGNQVAYAKDVRCFMFFNGYDPSSARKL